MMGNYTLSPNDFADAVAALAAEVAGRPCGLRAQLCLVTVGHGDTDVCIVSVQL